MYKARILRKPSDKDATQPLASVATDFGMRNLEKDLLEKFFRLLDEWDLKESSGNANSSPVGTHKC